jgi:hypothetical protein
MTGHQFQYNLFFNTLLPLSLHTSINWVLACRLYWLLLMCKVCLQYFSSSAFTLVRQTCQSILLLLRELRRHIVNKAHFIWPVFVCEWGGLGYINSIQFKNIQVPKSGRRVSTFYRSRIDSPGRCRDRFWRGVVRIRKRIEDSLCILQLPIKNALYEVHKLWGAVYMRLFTLPFSLLLPPGLAPAQPALPRATSILIIIVHNW